MALGCCRFVVFRFLVVLGSLLAAACEHPEPQPAVSFYERRIAPILRQSCANSPTQSGCHVTADGFGNAFGNLSVESYDALTKRRDLLVSYGPYAMPALLVKSVPPFPVRLSSWEGGDPIVITTDIPHAGGALLDFTGTALTQLERWIERGATENNTVAAEPERGLTPCSETPGGDAAFDPGADPAGEDYATFARKVNSVLGESCAAGNCHGAPSNSLYLTCGTTDAQRRWNYFAASDYVSAEAEASEILRRALAPSEGGTYHEGGALFASTSDPGYRALLEWAEEKGGPTHVPAEEGFRFFAQRAQPMLVKKGCMLLGCHSPAMGHDYRLRGGSGGHFGLASTRHNYELTLEQVALESPDPNASRLIRKNLVPDVSGAPPGAPAGKGIRHRGGALLGAGREDCDMEAARAGPLDEQDPYCVLVAWIELERRERMEGAAPFDGIVYVRRSPAPGRNAPQDYEGFSPGADLVRAAVSLDESGSLTVSGGLSMLLRCGIEGEVDVRRPAVSWDGRRVAFSARTAASEPWRIYVMDSAGCEVEPSIDAAPVDDRGREVPTNGELVHNFDPTFAPDGRIVFTSTRGNVTNAGVFDYAGPQRTPADPTKLNANLYVLENGVIRQLTFLLNQELLPSFMNDGRLIFTTEKRAPGFYQLAGRRMNLDGGDYHPLFAQRPTVGFDQFTDVVELADKNLAAIFSERGAAHGAGALGIVNRSLGIDQPSDDEAVYLQDPGAARARRSPFFQPSLRLFPGATGRLGGTEGAYRNPSPLPDGRLLVSFAPQVADLADFRGNFDIYVADPVTSSRSAAPLLADPDHDLLWPVAVYARADRGVFPSRPDEPNGATRVFTSEERRTRSEIFFLDVPLLSSLLFQNTRSERILSPDASPLEVWESLPPEPGVTSFEAGGSFVTADDHGPVYVRRRLLGTAHPDPDDGSVRVQIPGGMPIVLATHVQLVGDDGPRLHHQREEMQFYPGEWIRQGFRRDLFDGVCGVCHGSVTGLESHVAVNPDILTEASRVRARGTRALELLEPAGEVMGPPN